MNTILRLNPKCLLLVLPVVAALPLCGVADDSTKNTFVPEKRNVAIVIHEGVELLDFAGPGETFAAAAGGRAFNVYTVGETAEPIRSQGFLTVTPQYTIDNCPAPDIVVIPGGATNVLLRSPAMMKWARETATEAEIMFSVCTGVFVLADAGLLDGHEATTHASAISRLQEYDNIKVCPDRRVVDNGKTVTAAGVSAGIDGALHIVARLHGKPVAERTAKYMEYRWQPDAENEPTETPTTQPPPNTKANRSLIWS
jgi:transcriptional regulator GlxA family with amidase domain